MVRWNSRRIYIGERSQEILTLLDFCDTKRRSNAITWFQNFEKKKIAMAQDIICARSIYVLMGTED